MAEARALFTRLFPEGIEFLQVPDSIRPTEEEAQALKHKKHPDAVIVSGDEEWLRHQYILGEDEIEALLKQSTTTSINSQR